MSDVGEHYDGGRNDEVQTFNSGHNGTKTSSYTSLLDVPKRTLPSVDQETMQYTASRDLTRRHSKMTSSFAQQNDARSESCLKSQTQLSTEKDVPNSPKPSKSRRDQFCKVFPDIAETDEVIKSYHCAFFRDILLQGFLYITPNWFCFYSKLLGKRCIKIPVDVVTNITKKKTAIIIPNAIRVMTNTDKYVFGSLMSRDNTYQLMFSVWQEKRKVLQNSIPVELDVSDVNADVDSVVSVGANNTSNTSSKDTYAVSSDGSFCSDLESTSQSVDRLSLDSQLPSAVNQKTPLDVAKDGCQQTVCRCPSVNRSNPGAAMDSLNKCVQSKTPVTSLNDLITWILNFPRTCLFLTISTVLVLFLLVSAMLLAYKLINLQMQLATYVGWSYVDNSKADGESYREVLQEAYISRHDFHISNVEKIHMILESHVEVLNKVNQVLKELQNWAVSSCSSVTPAVDNS